ncbi:hypothetical protein M5K25_006452 [Dendrobium thyrsiflorum]|uniref:Uncharacterized protein n=1 Tax=Dendrobium thyrsiflorum TaxID=117978 RepID=A0ABD0VBL9_DENTH
MGKKWISAVKKIFSSESTENHTCEKSDKKLRKSKYSKNSVDPLEDSKNGQSQRAYSVAMATAVAAEAAMAAARAAAEMARLTTSLRAIHERPRKEVAAIKIQAAFRGYLVRRGTGTLRGLVRLKLMVNRMAVKRQTINTLHSMQTLARVQAQLRERKVRLSEENQTLHKQRQLKREKELEKFKLGEDWVASPHSKEQFQAKIQKKQEAARRRERTLAYAYSHQWRSNSARSKKPALIDPTKQQWGWSWLERWMAARPWETNQSFITGREHRSSDPSSKNNGALNKAASRRLSGPSPSTPPSVASNDDICGLFSFQSEQHKRRHSLGSSFCFGDVESRPGKSRFQAPITGKSKAKKPLPLTSASRRLSGPQRMASYGKLW